MRNKNKYWFTNPYPNVINATDCRTRKYFNPFTYLGIMNFNILMYSRTKLIFDNIKLL